MISIPVIGLGIAVACGGGYWTEYGTSNFTPEAFVDSTYKPFFYSQDFYYGIGHDDAHDTRFNETNTREWSGYFNNELPVDELRYMLTGATLESIDSASSFLAGKLKVLPLKMKAFKLFQTKPTKKTTGFIRYLILAKQCETFALNNFQYKWDYEPKGNKIQDNVSRLKKELGQGFDLTSESFLQQRYLFQLIRFHFFNSSPQDVITLFERNEMRFPKTNIYYRSLAYTAGAYYKLKNYSMANYHYSKVYDGCAELKTVAHYSFHPQDQEDWAATIALGKTSDEKATLWQMIGIFYSDEKSAIREIYTLNPKSEKLDVLLTRAINIEEQKFGSWDDKRNGTWIDLMKDGTNKDLLTLVIQIAEAGKTKKPYLWYIAAGYLNMLDRKYHKAKEFYANAEKTLPRELLLQAQLRLLKLLNTTGASTRIDSKLENDILKDLIWLHSSPTPNLRFSDAYEWIRQTLATKYYNQKEFVKSECFNSNSFFYADDKNVEAMKNFLDKPAKSPYEQLCSKLYIMKKEDLFEYQAIRLAFEDKLTEAITAMEKTGSAAVALPANPFNGRIKDCHDCDHEAAQKIKYTKLSLLKKMKDMQDKITEGAEVYNNSVLLAHAHYNITHYGNARLFYESKVFGTGHYSPFIIDSVFKGFLTGMKMAGKYYSSALKAAQNDEQKAKCHFMIAKCERNQWYNDNFYSQTGNEHAENTKSDFIAWKGFIALKQYPNSQYYKDVIQECGYFKTYTLR